MRHLYLICPTDHLERAICNCFAGDHYFVTSLGNAIAFNDEEIQEFNRWMIACAINNITFVLADDNRFVREALASTRVISTPSDNPLAPDLARALNLGLKQHPTLTDPLAITASLLEHKVQQLQAKLNGAHGPKIHVDATIYKRAEGQFVWPVKAHWRLADHQLN